MKTIGIIGGGQLGLMIIEQAHLLGARTVCLDPAADAPAFTLSDERIVERRPLWAVSSRDRRFETEFSAPRFF